MGLPIIYQPGSPYPGVAKTWTEVLYQIAGIRSSHGGPVPIELQFDDTYGDIEFDEGVHDMENVIWSVFPGRSVEVFFNILIPEGVQFTKLRSFLTKGAYSPVLTSEATATPPISDIQKGDIINVWGWQLQQTGGVALIEASGLSSGDLWVMNLSAGGTGFGGSGPCISNPVVGSLLGISFGPGGTLQQNTVSAVAGSQVFFTGGEDSATGYVQPAILGSISYIQTVHDRMRVTPTPPAPPATSALGASLVTSGLIRFDASGGAIAQSLAPANSGVFPGQKVIFKEIGGVHGVTLTPSGADTIDEGNRASVVVGPGEAVMLITNGINNWDVV